MTIIRPWVMLWVFLFWGSVAGWSADKADTPNSTEVESGEVEEKPGNSAHGKALIIPIDGVIIPDDSTIRFLIGGAEAVVDDEVIAAIDKAERDGASRIILEIDSPGGVVDACEKICQRLLASSLPSTALVTKRAISGGSMVATACNEIIMVTGTTIGDCEPHAINQKLPDYMREKVESPLRARMRANAEANGHPGKLLEAMVTKSIELYQVTYGDQTQEFLEKAQLELLESQIAKKEILKKIKGKTLVVREGRLLTLTAKESMNYGLSKSVVSSVGAFYADADLQESEIYRVEKSTEADESSIELSNQLLLVLLFCFIVGVAGVVVEVNIPGFGVPGIVGIIGFASFFTILFMHDRATSWEIGLFVIGLGLILVEIFVLPGFGVAGISGALCVLGALGLSMLPDFDSSFWEIRGEEEMDRMAYFFTGGAVGAFVLGWLTLKYLPKLPLLNHLILEKSLRSGGEVMSEAIADDPGEYPHEVRPTESDLKGVRGTAQTVLRPAGKMRCVNGRVLDVVSDGTMIAEGSNIEVVEVNGPRITVAKLGEKCE